MNKRIAYLIAIAILGIFSFTLSPTVGVFPDFILSYAPGFIWSSMIYMVFALIIDKSPVFHFTATVLTITAVAIAMKVNIPAVADFYSTDVGKTLLGGGFEIPMIVCYIVGLMACFMIDYVLDAVNRKH